MKTKIKKPLSRPQGRIETICAIAAFSIALTVLFLSCDLLADDTEIVVKNSSPYSLSFEPKDGADDSLKKLTAQYYIVAIDIRKDGRQQVYYNSVLSLGAGDRKSISLDAGTYWVAITVQQKVKAYAIEGGVIEVEGKAKRCSKTCTISNGNSVTVTFDGRDIDID